MSMIQKVLRRLVLPFLPASWQLPYLYFLHVGTLNSDRELKYLLQLTDQQGLAIDVGANLGLYSYQMSRFFDRVWAFEPNGQVTEPLTNYAHPHIRLFEIGLSSRSGSATLRIPVVDNVLLDGWASLEQSPLCNSEHFIEKEIEIHCLDEYAPHEVRLVKIDVEGHELEVLKGSRKTLARERPVLLVETHNFERERVVSFLDELGYVASNLQDEIGVKGSEEMLLFFPREKKKRSCVRWFER